MLRRFRAVGCLVGLCLTAVVLPAAVPQDPQEPVFRGGVTFVNVDAYPRRDGHVVEGLRAEDFQVLEDGKPQKVEAFEFIRIEPNTPDAERRDPNTKEDGDKLAADPHNRVFVVYLDMFHTGVLNGNQATRPLLQFLNRTIGPTDVFAVMTPLSPRPVSQIVFARSAMKLEDELTRYFDWPQAGQVIVPLDAFEEQAFGYCAEGPALIGLHRNDVMATSLEDLMVHLRDLRDERKNVLLITGGWVPRPPASALANRGRGAIPRIGTDPGGRLGIGVPQLGASNDAWCNQQIGQLANIDFEQRFRDLLTLARNANVSFYPIDVGGLRVNLPDASSGSTPPSARQVLGGLAAGRASVDTLLTLAENTDGRAIVDTNDLGAGFRRISDDLSAYYLLGYSSTNTNIDGKYRRIEVKVNQPKVSVTARRGYLAPSAATRAASAAKAAAATVPTTIAEALVGLTRLRLDNELLTYGVRSATGLDVVAEISSQEMARGRWSAGADVRVVLNRPNGEPIAATGRIEPAARGAVVHLPFAGAEAGPWLVSVRVSRDAASLEDRVEIPAPAASALLGAPIIFRGTASSRIPLRPVADFQFRRSERLRVEWPALKRLDQRTARLLDRKGQPLALNAAVTESAPGRPEAADTDSGRGEGIVAVDLNLAPLAEGDYLIELTAGAGGQAEQRLVAFRVVR